MTKLLFYQALAGLLERKDYFIVSLSENRKELEAAGLLPDADHGSAVRGRGTGKLGQVSALAVLYAESEALYPGAGSWF